MPRMAGRSMAEGASCEERTSHSTRRGYRFRTVALYMDGHHPAVLSGECPSAVCESECKQDGEPMTSDIAVSCESGGVDGTHGHSLATTGDNTRSADPGPIDRFRSPCRSIYAPLSGGVQGAILNAFQGSLGTSQ